MKFSIPFYVRGECFISFQPTLSSRLPFHMGINHRIPPWALTDILHRMQPEKEGEREWEREKEREGVLGAQVVVKPYLFSEEQDINLR